MTMGLLNWLYTRSHFEKGQECFKEEQFAEAVQYFLKAIEADDSPALAAFNLGLCYQRLGEFPEAQRSLCVAIKANPANAKASEVLALVQCVLGTPVEAERSARTALSCSIDHVQIFMSRMALVQALVCQLEICGQHHNRPDLTEEDFRMNKNNMHERW